jgi:hypothetical protein
MAVSKSYCLLRKLALLVTPGVICFSIGCGGDPTARPIGINVTPHCARAWANSAEDKVSFQVSVENSDVAQFC